MSNKKYYWLKLHKDFFKSKEMKKLRNIAGGDTFAVIYLKMSLLALETNGVIEYEGIEETFAEELALELDEDAVNVNATLLFLTNMKMIEEKNEGEFELALVKSNIGSETPQASSMRRKRNREKQALTSQNVTLLQKCEKSVTPEIELDREIEYREKSKSKNTPKPPKRGRVFTKPELVDVQLYCQERGKGVDPAKWYNYYEANGWKVGRNKMQDWKAAVRTWENNGYGNQQQKTANHKASDELLELF